MPMMTNNKLKTTNRRPKNYYFPHPLQLLMLGNEKACWCLSACRHTSLHLPTLYYVGPRPIPIDLNHTFLISLQSQHSVRQDLQHDAEHYQLPKYICYRSPFPYAVVADCLSPTDGRAERSGSRCHLRWLEI